METGIKYAHPRWWRHWRDSSPPLSGRIGSTGLIIGRRSITRLGVVDSSHGSANDRGHVPLLMHLAAAQRRDTRQHGP